MNEPMNAQGAKICYDRPGDVWFFAYGSLMWNPGFTPLKTLPALLHGRHRSFCVSSRHYRGTDADPGLVLGLDKGGSCHGYVHLVAEAERDAVFAELEKREMREDIYACCVVTPRTAESVVEACTFVLNRDSRIYAGKLPQDKIARRIARCAGERGSNREYLENTVRHLDELGIGDGPMHRLLQRVEALKS